MQGEALTTPRRKPSGKHPHARLKAVTVRITVTPGRYADGNGLYLVVDPSGAKRWLLRIVVRGRRCDLGLGSVSLVSLADAREQAGQLRRVARAGGDPLEARRRARSVVPTFKEAATAVHLEHAKSFRNAKHKAEWLSSLDRYAFPHFGAHRVDAVTSADVLKALGRDLAHATRNGPARAPAAAHHLRLGEGLGVPHRRQPRRGRQSRAAAAHGRPGAPRGAAVGRGTRVRHGPPHGGRDPRHETRLRIPHPHGLTHLRSHRHAVVGGRPRG